ncbi:MAG: multidrug effflux MFS transporter [Novosphingobium sp.]|nr:multidrug effflux MFS transporter [Novosphingobium sp.]
MGEREFVVMMAAIQALYALSIDVMLPALGVIATDLGEYEPNRRQLVIGVFLVCGGLASLFPGVISDRFGRRPIILVSLTAYTALSLTAAFVQNFTALLVLRGLTGLFVAAMMIVPIAIIRDRFSGDRMARTQSLVAMTFMVVPMLAPLLGQGIVLVAGWRFVFAAMAFLGLLVTAWVWIRLPETQHPEYRQDLKPHMIFGNMRSAVTNRSALGYFLGAALIQGALLGFISSAQQLMGEALGAGAAFPALFGLMALSMASTNFINSRAVMRFGTRRVSHCAVIAYIAVAAVHVWLAQGSSHQLWQFVALTALTMCCMSFLGANFQAIALQPFARIAGSAASVLSFIRLVLGAFMGLSIGQAFDGTARPLTLAILAAGVGTLALVAFSERGMLFGRRDSYDAERIR